MEHTESIEKFINKILEYQNRTSPKTMKDADLKRIADEMGLSEADWKSIQAAFDDHLYRAKSYFQYENLDDARKEAEQAATINPYHLETIYLLAKIHNSLWKANHNQSDKQKAIEYAQKCLTIEPTYEPSIRLISQLKKERKTKTNIVKARKSPKKQRQTMIIGTALAILLILGVIVFMTFNSTSDEMIYKSARQNDLQTVAAKSKSVVNTDFDVPIRFIMDDKSEGLQFNVQMSAFNSFENSFSYKLLMDMPVDGMEVEELDIRTDLITKNGDVYESKITTILNQLSPVARSGDIIPFQFFRYYKDTKMPEFSEVVVKVHNIRKHEAPPSYEPSNPVELKWDINRPPNYNIDVKERYAKITQHNNKNLYFKFEFEITNTGNTPIKKLCLQINWFDKQGNNVYSQKTYPTTTSKPEIKRGQTRIDGGTYRVKDMKREQYGKYTVSVIDIE